MLSYWEVVSLCVTSARYLSQAGHDVTVIDRESGPALETSAANAGQISGLCRAVGGTRRPLKALSGCSSAAPLAISLDGTQFQLKWMWQMLRNCDTRHYMENKGRMVRLAEYSRDCLKALRASTGIEYEGRRAARCSCSARRNSMKTPPVILPCWKMRAYRINCSKRASLGRLNRHWQKCRTS